MKTKAVIATGTDPTYKEWKRNISSREWLRILTRTDPTYKEWKRLVLLYVFKAPRLARILPTRNGNGSFPHSYNVPPISRTDPTYKEWKLDRNSCVEKFFILARILPTRNGNGVGYIRNRTSGSHGSYLQGMET